jgi:photosystem II stability/assembly factor-like uncharacterized protein
MRYPTKPILIILSLFFASVLHAQDWEKIGWNGGATDRIIKVGTTLYTATDVDGVYMSEDDADTWMSFNTGLPITNSSRRSIDITASKSYLWFTTRDSASNNVLYRRSFGGSAWESVATPSGYESALNLVYPTGGDTLLMSCIDLYAYPIPLAAIFLSPDAGITWQKIKSNLPDFPTGIQITSTSKVLCMYTDAYDTSEFFAADDSVYYSLDRGVTWTASNQGLPDSSYINEIIGTSDALVAEVYTFKNESYVFNGLYRSSDHGSTWGSAISGIDTAENTSILYLFTIDNDIIACMNLNSYKTSDGGATWQRVLNEYDFISFNSGVSTERGLLLSSTESILIANDNITEATALLYSTIGLTARPSWIVYSEDGTLYAVFSYGYIGTYIMRSFDNGESWQFLLPLEEYSISIADWKKSDDVYYIGGTDNATYEPVLITSNDLIDFQVASSLPVDGYIYSLDIRNDTILAGTRFIEGSRGYIYFSSNKGETWKRITPGTLSTSAHIGNATISGSKFYVTDDGGKLYASSNAGTNWYSSFTGLDADLRVQSIFEHRGKLYVIGNIDLGIAGDEPVVYVSSNDGLSWSKIGTGYAPNILISSCISDGQTLFLTTSPFSTVFGHPDYSTLYVSHDDGLTWGQAGNHFPNGLYVALNPDFVFTWGSAGCYRLPRSFTGVGDAADKTQRSTSNIVSYPNPASTEMYIGYTLLRSEDVHISAYDMTGRMVSTLADGNVSAGRHEVLWDTRTIPSGSYLIELIAGGNRTTTVVTILK